MSQLDTSCCKGLRLVLKGPCKGYKLKPTCLTQSKAELRANHPLTLPLPGGQGLQPGPWTPARSSVCAGAAAAAPDRHCFASGPAAPSESCHLRAHPARPRPTSAAEIPIYDLLPLDRLWLRRLKQTTSACFRPQQS